MKIFYSILTCLFVSTLFADPGDTTWVSSHDKTDMTWYRTYKDTASFPDGSKSYHKILMYYTMGCASNGCSDWDYTTRVYLMNPTGALDSNVATIDTISTSPLQIDTTWNVFEIKIPYELARVITPYGNQLSNNWSHEFVYDVTDFYPLLKNDVEIHVQYQGWSSGFSATVKFAMIEGVPAREVVKIENIYQGQGNYLVTADFENDHLPLKNVDIDSTTTGLLLTTNFSGHGFINALNCAEFCEKDYYVNVDGSRVATQAIWRDDCGLNPIWPQAGTWLYDRANWCPGDKSLTRRHDLTSSLNGPTMNIDLDIEPYTYSVPSGETPAGYNYSVQLFQYKNPSYQNDVELERIISPSNEDEFSRINPVCAGAKVRIRNKGANVLTSCEINYGMDGGERKIFSWSGNLGFMESEVVDLPFSGTSDWMTPNAEKVFIAIADMPNGNPDENEFNNWYESEISIPETYPADIKLTLITNNAASETHWKLVRLDDNTTMASGDNLTNGTSYIESLSLTPGCYMLHLEDRGKDGLSYQFNNDGNGSIRIQNDGGGFFFRNFNANFGTELKQYFTVGYGIGLVEPELKSYVNMYPNPASELINLDIVYPGNASFKLEITGLDGKLLHQQDGSLQDELKTELDLSHLPKGVYLFKTTVAEDVQIQKLILQ